MSLTSQPAAYIDCYDLFARAADTPLGVRTPFPTEDRAKHFQLRMHQARKIQRDQNSRIYPASSPLYNTSEYDALQVQIRTDGEEWWVYVRPVGENLEYIETLEPGDEVPALSSGVELNVSPTGTLQITHHKAETEV